MYGDGLVTHDEPDAPAASAPEFPRDPLPLIITGGTVSLLAGAPGVGKTALVATMAKAFRDSRPIFGHQPNPIAKVAFFSADRSWWQSSRHWFVRAGFPDIAAYSLQDDRSFNPKRLRKKTDRMKIFNEAVDKLELPPQSLLFCDPLAPFMGGNLLDYDAITVACNELQRLCTDRQITLVGLVHAGKQKTDKKDRYLRLQDRILGSSALFGYTDTQMYLASPAEMGEDHYTFLWQSHLAPAEVFKLKRDINGLFEPIEEVEAIPKRDLTPDLQAFYDAFPADEAVSLNFLIHLHKDALSRATVWRRLQDLKRAGWVEQIRHGYWKRKS